MKVHKANKASSYIYIYISIVVFSLTLLSANVLTAYHVSADDSVVDQVNITVSESCSMTGVGMDSHTAAITNGTYQNNIGTTTINVSCNDNSGFAIYAIGFTGDQYTGEDHTKLIGASNGGKITSGTATSGSTSNWAMKLNTVSSPTPAYPITLDNGFGGYSTVPDTYTKVAHRDSGTDVGTNATGAELTTTYAAYMSTTQVADTYTGKVKYTLVHPRNETPLQPQTTGSGKICYYANGSNVEGTMGCQDVASSVTLLASNFSRDGYGFAGWSTTFDYSDPTGFYGPQETIALTPADYQSPNNGLSLYAYWIKSDGNLQGWTGCSSLGRGAVTALTDQRDNQTYAIAKLADGKCWMIENLRLDNTATLTLTNTNNPLNNGTNVTLKHNYADTDAFTNLSANSNVAYNADTAPDGWCTDNSSACDDQSRLRTDNTANRATYTDGQTVSSQNASIYSYGNYYNWYSATAGNGTYSFSTDNNSVAGDLCPAGWRLPKGSNKTRIVNNGDNEFWNLTVVALNNNTLPANYETSTAPYYTGTEAGPVDKALRTYPNNYLYSGYVLDEYLFYRGSDGDYWSSTANYSYHAYYLYLSSSRVTPGASGSNKYLGRTVRCIAQ